MPKALAVRAYGEDTELTRANYGDLLDVVWMVTPFEVGDARPDVISILISQEV